MIGLPLAARPKYKTFGQKGPLNIDTSSATSNRYLHAVYIVLLYYLGAAAGAPRRHGLLCGQRRPDHLRPCGGRGDREARHHHHHEVLGRPRQPRPRILQVQPGHGGRGGGGPEHGPGGGGGGGLVQAEHGAGAGKLSALPPQVTR